jgi:hypothetical protein
MATYLVVGFDVQLNLLAGEGSHSTLVLAYTHLVIAHAHRMQK